MIALCAACEAAPIEPDPEPDPDPDPEPDPVVGTIGLREVVAGLSFPVFLTAPPGDASRLFVVEKGGRIVIVRNGAVDPTPFLDISAKVTNSGEQGLLGMAFHPQYAQNGLFILNYIDTQGDTRIATFRVSADPDVADPASEHTILFVDQPYSNHNGGMLAFGPDGRLYIALGDGGGIGDPDGNAQNRGTVLGKILRLSVAGDGTASVPEDNPFVEQDGLRPEIWSYGLRNPWRFSFDRLTGDLYIGDVGDTKREEIDVATAAAQLGRGRNYGWSILEGTTCFNPSTNCDTSGLTPPVLEYVHPDGCSVTGGYVYRGSAIPALRGHYFYADFCAGWVRSFRLSGTGTTNQQDWTALRPGGLITSFGEDPQGELYILTSDGTVKQVVLTPP